MGDTFDYQEALKDHPESEVAQYIADQHGIDRNAYLQDGQTDADFIKEYGPMPLPVARPHTPTQTQYSPAAGAVLGGATGAAIQAKPVVGAAVDIAKQKLGIQTPQQTTFTPPPTTAAPAPAAQAPVSSGPTENWARSQHTGEFYGGQDYKQSHALAEGAKEFNALNTGFVVPEGGSLIAIPKEELERQAAEKAKIAEEERIRMEAEHRAREYIGQKEAERAAAETAAKTARAESKISKIAKSPIAKGALIGGNAIDVINRVQEPGWRNKVAAGLNALAAASAAAPGTVEKIPYVKKMAPFVSPALTGLAHIVADEPEQKAAGGSVQSFAAGSSALSPIYEGVKTAVGVPLKYAAKAFNPALMGYSAYESGKDAQERLERGDKTGAAISGLSALASGASTFPPAAAIGVPISMGADAINFLRDNPHIAKKLLESYSPDQPMMAKGGAVKKFASGKLALAEKAAEETLPYIKSFLKNAKSPESSLAEALAKNPVNIPEQAHQQIGNYNALPLNLPRAKPKTDQELQDIAARVARQMTGEHVTSGKIGDTTNLAGRSLRESNRVKGLDYTVEPTGASVDPVVFHPKTGDIMLGYPGDQTISDQILQSIGPNQIGSLQTGGGRYGLGQRDLPEGSKWWNSEKSIANMIQNKGSDLTLLPGADPNRIFGEHMGMGRVANNFAQHMADANLKAIDVSKMKPEEVEGFNSLIREGWSKPNPKKSGERIYYKFPEFPGIENPDDAYMAMLQNPEMRKFFNAKMKTPSVTSSFSMPNGLDVEWAVTEPQLRNMEVGMTGLSTGRVTPFAKTAPDPTYPMYGTSIPGVAIGHSDVLKPVEIAFPDATQHILSTQRPQDFTGTIQKVFPHQIVDDQYLNEYGAYRDLIKKYTGQKKGGSVQNFGVGGEVAKLAEKFILPAAENAARTQIIGTLPTYQKAADILAQRGATGQAIDFGAGLGKGAAALGEGTHTYEPFAQNWNPTFTKPEDIPTDAYNRLTNLNVLNVVPREMRDEIVQHIGRVMEPGGLGILTTRGKDVMGAKGIAGPEPMSIITSRDTYQKGFTPSELQDYLKYMLGDKFDINKLNLGPAGAIIQKKK